MSGYESIKEDILRDVAEKGEARVDYQVLINSCFKADAKTSDGQMREWAKENNLRLNFDLQAQGSKRIKIAVFTRDRV